METVKLVTHISFQNQVRYSRRIGKGLPRMKPLLYLSRGKVLTLFFFNAAVNFSDPPPHCLFDTFLKYDSFMEG